MNSRFQENKIQRLGAEDNKYLYEGETKKDDRSKEPVYHGAGYLFNNETKCFFKGTWKDGQKVCGIETFPNGDVYEGSYLDGKFNGLGLIYNNVSGKYRYEGHFRNGKKEGEGKEEYTSGGSYEGYFRDGQKHGQGKLVFADGSYYMGDFQKGLPNGFGLHVAYHQSRIITVFPIKLKSFNQETERSVITDSETSRVTNRHIDEEDEIHKNNSEYYYEGEFIDGYKHGIGRLYEPSGSYYYGYWEYNKPVGRVVYYNADEHNYRICDLNEMAEYKEIDFYEIFRTRVQIDKKPITASGYPDPKFDACKSLIDEKGLKREHFEDLEFDFQEMAINIKDETGQLVAAPVDYKRITEIVLYKKKELFISQIEPGSLRHQENYSCQQLTCVLDAMTYHSYLFQKIFSRRYDYDIGFYTLKFFMRNRWREYVIDDMIPVLRNDEQTPIFSNNKYNDLGWALLFKCFAKMNNSFTYFENQKNQIAEQLLSILTGMPCKRYQLSEIFKNVQEHHHNNSNNNEEKRLQRLWTGLTEKHQKTHIRICYLRREKQTKLNIPINYAYHIVDHIVASPVKQTDEDKFLLLKALSSSKVIKQDLSDTYDKVQQNFINKLRERIPDKSQDSLYFVMGLEDFIAHFDTIIMLAGTKYPVHNHLEINPKENDLQNNELRIFTKFAINLPCSMLFSFTQQIFSDQKDAQGELIESQDYMPVRLVLARQKDSFSNKIQIKKSVTKTWSNFKSDKTTPRTKDNKRMLMSAKNSEIETFDLNKRNENKGRPFRYIFGRGQKQQREVYKEITLESGNYIFFAQVEQNEQKKSQKQQNLDRFKFHINIFSQSLVQIMKIPQIIGFQKLVYESAILNAEKKTTEDGREIKFFSKVDLADRENGSGDLIIIQYFLKHEGTYLQYLRNKSTNKIWRQKLYFKVENMIILEQSDASRVDLQLNTSDRRTELVVIQQVGAKPYSLEGGEGICIIDIQSDKKEGDDSEKGQQVPDDGATQEDQKPKPVFKEYFSEFDLKKQ